MDWFIWLRFTDLPITTSNMQSKSKNERYSVKISTLASSVTMSSALEVEFVLRSLIPLSEPRVTLILGITENSFQKCFLTLTYCQASLLPAPDYRLFSDSACLRVSLHSSDYVIIHSEFVIIKCPHSGSCHDASCLKFFSQQSSVQQFTRLFIIPRLSMDCACTINSKVKRSKEIIKIQY